MSFSVPDSLFWTIVLFLGGLVLICIAGDKFVDAAVAIAEGMSGSEEAFAALMNKEPRELKGPEPDFSEEGWAMRRPRKKK